MKLEKILEQYGLTTKEATIYLACLEIGSGSVYKISQKSGLPRSTCYEVLENLQQLGLVTTFRQKNIQHFNAEDPTVLVERSKNQMALIEQAMPYFQSHYATNRTTPSVRLYQGKNQVKLVLNEILKEAKELSAISSADDLFKEITDFPEFVKKRIAKKIPLKVILRDSPKARQRQMLGQKELRQVKLMPKEFEFHAMTYLWKDKVALFSLSDDFTALVVESEQIKKLHQATFDYMWQSLG